MGRFKKQIRPQILHFSKNSLTYTQMKIDLKSNYEQNWQNLAKINKAIDLCNSAKNDLVLHWLRLTGNRKMWKLSHV